MLSYTDLAVTAVDALAYVISRGYSGWPALEADQLLALRRGQDYIAREYNDRWCDEFENAAAPELVQLAIFEASLVEARNPSSLSPVVKASDAKMLTGVEGLTWTPISGPSGVEALKPRLMHVEVMLRSLIKGKQVFLARA